MLYLIPLHSSGGLNLKLHLFGFIFLGFIPKSKKKLEDLFNSIAQEKRTIVFFVSNHKIKECLEILSLKIKEREISVCKEITKKNEMRKNIKIW